MALSQQQTKKCHFRHSDNDISLLIINLAKKMFLIIILSAGNFVGKVCSEMLDEVPFLEDN